MSKRIARMLVARMSFQAARHMVRDLTDEERERYSVFGYVKSNPTARTARR